MPETSESEEMYLLTVAVAEEDGHRGPLGLSTLASTLGVSAASANEMIHKLGVRRLVDYRPYHGVELTEVGKRVARRVLRTRRLWVAFLVDHLGLSPRRADTLACQLEHVTPPETSDRLADFLGHPGLDPLGRAIPTGDSAGTTETAEPMTAVGAGAQIEVVSVDVDDTTRTFLGREGIFPGGLARVVAIGSGGVLLDTEQSRVHLDDETAGAVFVRATTPTVGG